MGTEGEMIDVTGNRSTLYAINTSYYDLRLEYGIAHIALLLFSLFLVFMYEIEDRSTSTYKSW